MNQQGSLATCLHPHKWVANNLLYEKLNRVTTSVYIIEPYLMQIPKLPVIYLDKQTLIRCSRPYGFHSIPITLLYSHYASKAHTGPISN